jgi:pSer/pThr/pTyr-binding forkhead associated (FHA) protein
MQNINMYNDTGLSLEFFHVQTNTSFDLPSHLAVILIGKPHDQGLPDIDVSTLPEADVVSRLHAQVRVESGNYFIEDLGSANGTFINDIRLEPKTPYQLNLGDKIDLGQGAKVTFIFQNKLHIQSSLVNTSIQHQAFENSKVTSVDTTSKFLGLVLIVTGIIILTANIQVGMFFRIPGILLCGAGIFVLCQKRINRNLGWILIAFGIAVIIFTGNIFASTNLLILITSSALLFAGYQLLTTGQILGYSWRSLKGVIRK